MRTEEEINEMIGKFERLEHRTPKTDYYVKSSILLLKWVLSSAEEDLEERISYFRAQIAYQEIEERKKLEIEYINKLKSPEPTLILMDNKLLNEVNDSSHRTD